MAQFPQRRDRLRQQLAELEADAILMTNFTNVSYLTGFTGDDSYLLVTVEDTVVLSDSRYEQQLLEECPDVKLEIRRAPTTLLQLLEQVMGRLAIKHLAFESETITWSLVEKLKKQLEGVELVPAESPVEKLREIKDEEEIREIRSSIQLASEAFQALRENLTREKNERQLAAELEYAIRCRGGKGCSFQPIIAVGPNAALPHAQLGDRRVGEADLLLVDWGATRRQYLSDLTRVLVTGTITPELERIYGVVLTAQAQAIGAIRPGAAMEEVDSAAREVITDAGYGDRFGHGLGHGFGLEIHEQPRLAPGQRRRLEPGMVVTVEPGIYIPGWGGIRIEDDVLVTEQGHEVLSSVPKTLSESIVSLGS